MKKLFVLICLLVTSIGLADAPLNLQTPAAAPAPSLKRELSEEFRLQALLLKSSFGTSHEGIHYNDLKASSSFKKFLVLASMLKSFDLNTLRTKEQKIAFWINIYNALIIHGIIAHEIQKQVLDYRGFFEKVSYQISSYSFSLDDIEHGILRANSRPTHSLFRQFKRSDPRLKFALTPEEFDPRIHFALNCGSKSCPPISFYSAERINEQLGTAARGFINAETEVKDGRIYTSKIFDWYSRDFRPSVAEFIETYASESLRSKLQSGSSIKFKDYNWSLNSD